MRGSHMFEERLNNILKELEEHKGHDRAEVMQRCISERLEKCLQTYYEELSDTVTYLQLKKDRKVLNASNKL